MSGITTETVSNLLLDAGTIYVDYGLATERILGATDGGNTYLNEREIREISVDGAKGKVKGLRRIITDNAMLTVNLKEMSAENIKLALAGSAIDSTTDPLYSEIRSTGTIADADYKDNVAFVGTVSGSENPVVIILENVLSDGNFEIGTTDKEEGVVAVQFSSHYDPADMDTVPHAVRYPVMA